MHTSLGVNVNSLTFESLIAIMLSRLRMNIDDCIAEYTGLGNRIFGNQLRLLHTQRRLFSLRGPILWNREKYDHKKLENAVQEVVNKRLNVSRDRAAGQMFPSDESRCRTYVCPRLFIVTIH
jgi:hypothetical protein